MIILSSKINGPQLVDGFGSSTQCVQERFTLADHAYLLGNFKERNARGFERKESTNARVLQKIKDEACLWVVAGAKHLKQQLNIF
jgi:hypothetical protein